MHSLKATLILSLTTLILFAGYIAYNSNQDRFVLLPIQSDKSIYVFDRKNNVLNYCTSDNQCKLIKLNLPAEHEPAGSMLPASLLGMIDSKNNKSKEITTAKSIDAHKAAVTVAATHAASTAGAGSNTTSALVAADIHTPAAVPPMPAVPTTPAIPSPVQAQHAASHTPEAPQTAAP